jgi:hypothetical protein
MIIDTIHCTKRRCDCPGNMWWSGWVGSREVHVVPIDDLYTHHFECCFCDPEIRMHNGFETWQVVHNSFDGRELSENERNDECGDI